MEPFENPHARRLYESLLHFTDETEAARITSVVPLTKTASDAKRYQWAEAVCGELARRFDGETVREIRAGCACGPSRKAAAELRALYERAADTNDFSALCEEKGWHVTADKGGFLIRYNQCYCSCVKRGGRLPRAWCECTVGFNRRMFGELLGRPVEAELLESVKLGDKQCLIRVTPTP